MNIRERARVALVARRRRGQTVVHLGNVQSVACTPAQPSLTVNAIIESVSLYQNVVHNTFAGQRELTLSVRVLASDVHAYDAFWRNLNPHHDGVVKLWVQPRGRA